ncbi:hypothetical protein CPB83DRAFT_922555 [Crepidotus variabilis]|uniref:Uncharacterized protein n=1 Tax=Crepidotus variabilis TaxID=179855 RepID=A0A9P6E390_9AGAR|nr:hypothetical protein CPB83DRAFT_922555 [Crepidotus variabilis]
MSFFYDISEPSEEQQGLTFSDFVATNSFFQPLATARGLNTTYQSLVLAGETSLGTDGVELEARVAFARAGLVFNYSLEQALLPADFLLSNELGGPGFCQSKEEDAVAFSFDFAGQPFDMPEGPSLPNDASKAQELQKLAFEFQEMSVVEEGYEPSPGDQDTSILPVSFSGPPTSEEESKHTTGPGVSLEFIESFDFDLIDSSSTRSLKPKKPMPPNSLKNTRGISALGINQVYDEGAKPTPDLYTQTPGHMLLERAAQIVNSTADSKVHKTFHRIDTTKLQSDVRKHTRHLLDVRSIDTISNGSGFVDPRESQRFEIDVATKNGPSVNHFSIDLVSESSKWNNCLAVVFTESYINSGLHYSDEEYWQPIFDAFVAHLNAIRGKALKLGIFCIQGGPV